ncbi:hypothetical protein K438DRAFT_1630253 [Mycena galopus ATCC 62051]|nr:hypothetical protein K438DRAFT_1630253 [Mycena galopus ATCC 62051]
MNLLSACLSVGSPALATYSLALTAFNRGYIATNFRRLREMVKRDTHRRYRYMDERISAATFILQESQQCPMRANQRNGELASLIALSDREQFWKSAAKDLKNTRRGFTYSFLAQVILAFVTYVISFSQIVHDDLGSVNDGLQFASSSVWSWIAQSTMNDTSDIPLLPLLSTATGDQDEEISRTNSNSTLLSPVIAISDAPELDHVVTLPTWLGMDVRGDERREGPIFNYARILTWFAFAKHVESGFESAVEEFRAQRPIPTTAQDAAARCRLELHKDLPAFTAWSRIPRAAIQHMFWAGFLALFLQWGTTGAAIFIWYTFQFKDLLTPASGVGCRSGSYLIYGVAATISWLLLVFSNLVSHALMQRLEQNPRRKGGVGILGGVAVLSRIVGKAIAIANAAWLIASSVLEEIGTFETCWCKACAVQFHTKGWTAIFVSPSALQGAASGIWVGGFLWSITVCSIVIVVFAYGRH